jgi:hypothetical protein
MGLPRAALQYSLQDMTDVIHPMSFEVVVIRRHNIPKSELQCVHPTCRAWAAQSLFEVCIWAQRAFCRALAAGASLFVCAFGRRVFLPCFGGIFFVSQKSILTAIGFLMIPGSIFHGFGWRWDQFS